MPLRDDLADGTIEVVLRIPNENGMVDTADRDTLETETRFLTFERDAKKGIGELRHRLAFVTWVVPLGESKYRLETCGTGIRLGGTTTRRRRAALRSVTSSLHGILQTDPYSSIEWCREGNGASTIGCCRTRQSFGPST